MGILWASDEGLCQAKKGGFEREERVFLLTEADPLVRS